MASSAGPQLAVTAVVLECLGERSERGDLFNLCLVNRLFYFEFSRILYGNIDMEDVRRLPKLVRASRNMDLVKSISMPGSSYGYGALPDNGPLQKILPLMTRLESFKWSWRSLAKGTMKALRQSPNRLRHLHIEYPRNEGLLTLGWRDGHWDEDRDDDWSRMMYTLYEPSHLVGIKNLESLTMLELYGPFKHLRRHLANVLVKSPRLQKLELSLDDRNFVRESNLGGNVQECLNFFNLVADEFAEKGGAPLRLKTFRCGRLILPTREESLRKLVDFSQLEDVRLKNRNIGAHRRSHSMYINIVADDGTTGMPFHIFVGECPKLRQLTLSEMARDVSEALKNTDGSHLSWRQVAVSVPEADWKEMSGVSNAFVFRTEWINKPRHYSWA